MKPSEKVAFQAMGLAAAITGGVWYVWPGGTVYFYLIIFAITLGSAYSAFLQSAAHEKIVDGEPDGAGKN